MIRSTAVLSLLLLLSGLASAQNAGSSRWLVAFQPGTTPAQRAQALDQAGLQTVREFPELGVAVAAQRPGTVAAEVFALEASPAVAGVEEDFYADWLKDMPAAPDAAAPMESLYDMPLPTDRDIVESAGSVPVPQPKDVVQAAPAGSTGLVHLWGIERLHVPEARAMGLNDGSGVRVAVIDTGIDASHPELMRAVAGGYNARWFENKDAWKDDNGHGTHVSGTIAAAGIRVIGVAPGVRLYAVKVLDKNGGGFLTDIVSGILWCARNHIQVANMSLGSSRGSFIEKLAIDYAVSKGVTIVAAAGNGDDNGGPGPVDYPGAYPEVIAVSALQQPYKDHPETITDWSSRGPQVAFIAPGDGIYSTWLNGGYDTLDGTSMATPHVTGMAALAVAMGFSSPSAVRAALTAAAVPVPGLTSDEEGAGVLDARLLFKERP